MFHRLLQALGLAIYAITDKVYPQRLHNRDSSQVLTALHHFLQSASQDEQFSLINDDLIGFFTSVPHDRIVQAIQHAVSRYAEHHHQQGITGHISVKLKEISKETRTFNGKYRKPAKNEHSFQLAHVPELCEFAIKSSHFQWCNLLYKQIQGAPIGGPASPAISHLVVSFEEQMWFETFHSHLQQSSMLNNCFVQRYVDNRLILVPQQLQTDPILRILLHKNFYKTPIELEEVGDQHFLGFNIEPMSRQVTYMMPGQNWQFRHPSSAGSMSLKLSSLSSRMYILCRGVFPTSSRKCTAYELAQQYIQRGFPSAQVFHIVDNILQRFKH
jgi:hypothetical protein